MERSGSGCTAVAGFCEHGNEPSVFLNCREFNSLPEELSDFHGALWSVVLYTRICANWRLCFNIIRLNICLQYGSIYIGQSKFVAALNCAPNLTTYRAIWSLLRAFGNTLRWVVRLTTRPLYYRRQWPRQCLTRTFCVAQCPFWQFREHKNLLPLPEFEIWLPVRPARGLVTTPTMACLLLCLHMNLVSRPLSLMLPKINVRYMTFIKFDNNVNAGQHSVVWVEKG